MQFETETLNRKGDVVSAGAFMAYGQEATACEALARAIAGPDAPTRIAEIRVTTATGFRTFKPLPREVTVRLPRDVAEGLVVVGRISQAPDLKEAGRIVTEALTAAGDPPKQPQPCAVTRGPMPSGCTSYSEGGIVGPGTVYVDDEKVGYVDAVQWQAASSNEYGNVWANPGELFVSTRPQLTDAQIVRAAALSYHFEVGDCRLDDDGSTVGDRGSQLYTDIVEMRPDLKDAIHKDVDELHGRRQPFSAAR